MLIHDKSRYLTIVSARRGLNICEAISMIIFFTLHNDVAEHILTFRIKCNNNQFSNTNLSIHSLVSYNTSGFHHNSL